MIQDHAKTDENVPQGFKVLTEGQANILYIVQNLNRDEEGFVKIQGGRKRIANEINEQPGAVFYNPVQEFNRDISIAVIREYSKIINEERIAKGKETRKIKILEALAATGLRTVRYLKEIDSIETMVSNDWDPAAVELMKKNIVYNNLKEDKCETFSMDAIDLMNKMRAEKRFFDVIDLDPYGSAIPFLESALSCLANGGLLCVTFTDMAVLCARRPHVCSYKYGSVPLPQKYCHEFALRMVLNMISQMANRNGRTIIPYLSLSADFYIRLFIRVKDSPIECHRSFLKYSQVYQCIDCESFYLQSLARELADKRKEAGGHRIKNYKDQNKQQDNQIKENEEDEEESEEEKQGDSIVQKTKVALTRIDVPAQCKVCDGHLTIGGPIWNKPLHNIDLVKRIMGVVREQKEVKLGTSQRIQGILTGIVDEYPLENIPLNYDLSYIASSLKVQNPSKKEFLFAINQYGFKAVQTYYNSKLWKTNAPPEILYDIFKSYKFNLLKNDKEKVIQNLNKTTAGYRIFQKKLIKENLNFDFRAGKDDLEDKDLQKQLGASKKKQKKYFSNPEPNWGPKSRATGNS